MDFEKNQMAVKHAYSDFLDALYRYHILIDEGRPREVGPLIHALRNLRYACSSMEEELVRSTGLGPF